MIRSTITALARHLPPQVVTNQDLQARLATSDEWIRARTGITERRVAPGTPVSDLILPAARECLARRGVVPRELDCVIVATVTPDFVMPSTASVVQRRLGARCAWGFDLGAACSGFVYALSVASALVESGRARRVLLCAADRCSAITDPEDRRTAILFGDAATAVLLEPSADPALGVLDCIGHADPVEPAALFVPAGGSARPADAASMADRAHFISMDGQRVYRAAVAGMSAVTCELLDRNRLSPAHVAWYVPHQANSRIIAAVAERVGIARDRVAENLGAYGNTMAATIPLCLSEWHEAGRFTVGDHVVLASFGAGFTMGAALLRWSATTN